MVGPKIEFYRGSVFEDEELAKILPFLALPDGAHLTTEDYSYFHLVPTSPIRARCSVYHATDRLAHRTC
ncbi:hypothetical protein OBBRIDRAFT_799597 [Obba rivulosa]|uniref:AVL9/DENND6 domain-containing protein n=1 Tax=Obba rivulosa TaxID=1052685 RepID=A0A8E2DEE1_9APHY|nr:hypothetical protein OBBRIDRAFT_799597 [Obba rivulosa]